MYLSKVQNVVNYFKYKVVPNLHFITLKMFQTSISMLNVGGNIRLSNCDFSSQQST